MFRCKLLFFAMATVFLMLPILSLAQVSQNTLEREQPQWELGAGLITLNTPDYPGSDINRLRAIPFPYYIYRGEYMRADDEGTRARLLSSKTYETGLSFNFNFPVRSENNLSRQGMPDLDALFSIGPRLLFRLLPESKNHKLNLSFAGRWAFSSKISFNNLMRYEGVSFEPRLNYWYQWPRYQLTLFSSLGFEIGSAKYNSYFYNVSSDYSFANRPSYVSKAGLVESSLGGGFGKRLKSNLFMFSGFSYRNLNGAANNNSPLVKTQHNISFVLGLIWTFLLSEEKVQTL